MEAIATRVEAIAIRVENHSNQGFFQLSLVATYLLAPCLSPSPPEDPFFVGSRHVPVTMARRCRSGLDHRAMRHLKWSQTFHTNLRPHAALPAASTAFFLVSPVDEGNTNFHRCLFGFQGLSICGPEASFVS